MLVEEKGSVIVIDDVRGNLRIKLPIVVSQKVKREWRRTGATGLEARGGQDYIPRKFPAVRSEYDAVPSLLLRWRFKSCHDSLCVLNISGAPLGSTSTQMN